MLCVQYCVACEETHWQRYGHPPLFQVLDPEPRATLVPTPEQNLQPESYYLLSMGKGNGGTTGPISARLGEPVAVFPRAIR